MADGWGPNPAILPKLSKGSPIPRRLRAMPFLENDLVPFYNLPEEGEK
jgi:hypothetical protein